MEYLCAMSELQRIIVADRVRGQVMARLVKGRLNGLD
jgi:hypothetical protein